MKWFKNLKISKKLSAAFVFLLLSTPSAIMAGGGHHHAGVFSGVTTNFYAEHTDLTFGVDYEYRFSKLFGVGVIGDLVAAKHIETLVLGGVFIHPFSSFKFLVGNGVAIAEHVSETESNVAEDNHHSEDTHASDAVHTETAIHYVLRLGAGYDIHLGQFSITPTVNWDLINGHFAVAYGLTFGIGF